MRLRIGREIFWEITLAFDMGTLPRAQTPPRFPQPLHVAINQVADLACLAV